MGHTECDKFVDTVAEENVRLDMKKLRDRSVVLRGMIDKGEITLVGARLKSAVSWP
jgi:carbonic anhydrase